MNIVSAVLQIGAITFALVMGITFIMDERKDARDKPPVDLDFDLSDVPDFLPPEDE